MRMYCKEVKEVCGEYVHRYHRVPCDGSELCDLPLTGKEISMSGSDLYRFLLWLEDYYQISLTADLIRKEGFRTINQIASLVSEVLEEKDEESSRA